MPWWRGCRIEVRVALAAFFVAMVIYGGGKGGGGDGGGGEGDGAPPRILRPAQAAFTDGPSTNGSLRWNSEMFKRLWQSGCNSAYYAVTWRGDAGWPNGLFYHEDVHNAFLTAPHLTSALSSLSSETMIIAHSLGNMVVSSAIQDHGFRPDRYFMLNAAVPAEAFDATQWNTSESNNPFEFEDWVGYPAKSWASCWHALFPTNDIRGRLTWKARFAEVPQRTALYNYYSSGDEVLSVFDTPDSDGSGKITITPFGLGGSRYHSWQKQERFKGRWGQSAVGFTQL